MRSVAVGFHRIKKKKKLRTAFSNNTVDGTILILGDCSLTISRAPFNLLMTGGDKGHAYVSKPPSKTCSFVYVCICFSYQQH